MALLNLATQAIGMVGNQIHKDELNMSKKNLARTKDIYGSQMGTEKMVSGPDTSINRDTFDYNTIDNSVPQDGILGNAQIYAKNGLTIPPGALDTPEQVLSFQQFLKTKDPNALPKYGVDSKRGSETEGYWDQYGDLWQQSLQSNEEVPAENTPASPLEDTDNLIQANEQEQEQPERTPYIQAPYMNTQDDGGGILKSAKQLTGNEGDEGNEGDLQSAYEDYVSSVEGAHKLNMGMAGLDLLKAGFQGAQALSAKPPETPQMQTPPQAPMKRKARLRDPSAAIAAAGRASISKGLNRSIKMAKESGQDASATALAATGQAVEQEANLEAKTGAIRADIATKQELSDVATEYQNDAARYQNQVEKNKTEYMNKVKKAEDIVADNLRRSEQFSSAVNIASGVVGMAGKSSLTSSLAKFKAAQYMNNQEDEGIMAILSKYFED